MVVDSAIGGSHNAPIHLPAIARRGVPGCLLHEGLANLPCLGDGRHSGTAGSPSILNASPDAQFVRDVFEP